MRTHPLLAPEALDEARKAVADAERRTSAEFVIAARRTSDTYPHAPILWGLLVAFIALLAILFVPQEFPLHVIPFDIVLAYALGDALCRALPALRRTSVARSRQAQAVRRAACEAFVGAGISKTRGRTGVLVYASIFERRVEIVPDIGIPIAELGDRWTNARAALERAIRDRDAPAFFREVRALGTLLGQTLPRAEDDVNELPDAMEVAR